MAVAFEPAGPGSPLPAWPNSGELVRCLRPGSSRVTCLWDVPVVHFSRSKRRRITHCTSHREWISADWILTSALQEASDGILTELDVLAMFSAQAEDPWLFGDAIDYLLEGVMVAASMYLHAAALAQLASIKFRFFASSAEDPWTLQHRLNGPHLCDVEEWLRLRVVLVAKSLGTPSDEAYHYV